MSPATRTVSEIVRIRGTPVTLTNPQKVLFPADGITKGDLVAYYRELAPLILPHVRGRPLTVQRYVNGIDGESFFEKDAPRGLPDWVRTVTLPSHGRHDEIRFVICESEATLAYLANLAAIVLHVWTSRAESLDRPDFVFFDLDPDETCTLETLVRTALALRDELAEIGLRSLVKTSGGSGLHVLVPLAPHYDYEIVKTFAELAARTLHDRLPDVTTLERSIAKRPKGGVYLDYVQVGRGKTLVAPFSVRARAGAPISWPLRWDEVEALRDDAETNPERAFARYGLRNARTLLVDRVDPWRGVRGARLEKPLNRAGAAWA